jgi:uncharacterized membrane-anchored protein YitT (DUF2179 family)
MKHQSPQSIKQITLNSFWLIIGAFLAAYSVEVFLVPNHIIDGGIIGLSILISQIFDEKLLYPCVLLFNIPFMFLAYKNIARGFVINMFIASLAFTLIGHSISASELAIFSPYKGELLEIVVIGGLILGVGVGLVIRVGGCIDGTEILGVIFNKRYGVSVGSVVLGINCILFTGAGFVFKDWHPPIQSLITFFVVIKIMDMVIVGLDEMKSIMIFSDKAEEVSQDLIHEMNLGLTLLPGKGGYSGEDQTILFLIAERLQLAEIKNLVHAKDPNAIIAIENIHEISTHNMKNISNKESLS